MGAAGRKLVGVGVGLLLVAACATRTDGPPEITVDKTACSQCGMLISELAYAAAYRVPGAEGRAFDDIGCLLAAARQEPGAAPHFWFHDAAGSGWIAGTSAVFVTSPSLRTPMGGAVVAYRHRSDADRAAATHRGEVIASLPALLARTGGKS